MPLLTYFSISSAPHLAGTAWLIVDTGPVGAWLEELRAAVTDGRLPGTRTLGARASLEGAHLDYTSDEIQRSLERSTPLPYENLWGGAILVAEPFLSALEAERARFRAFNVTIEHPSTGRSWRDHWLVWFPECRPLRLLRNDDVPVLRPGRHDALMSVLYAPRLQASLDRLGYPGLTFKRHDWPACEATPLGVGPDADAALRQAACAAFIAKTPLPSPGARFGTSWLMESLLARFSDVTEERLSEVFRAEAEADLFVEIDGGALTGIGVREDTATARALEERRMRGGPRK